MRRSKSAYMNYVCPGCWNTINKCTCDLFPPYELVFIDKDIQEHIRILNEKKYKTFACCSGHHRKDSRTYIAFMGNYFENLNLPEGFGYSKIHKVIFYDYSNKLSKEEFEKINKEKLDTLLKWCKDLPSYK